MKAADSANFSACLTFRVRNKNQYFLLDVLRERLEFLSFRKWSSAMPKDIALTPC